jgi:hypothetical protein
MGWLLSVTPRPRFTPGNNPRYPLDRWLGEPQSWSGHRIYRRNHLPLPGSNPGSAVCSQTLYWLSYLRSDRLNTSQFIIFYSACLGMWKTHIFVVAEVLGFGAVRICTSMPTFRRNTLSPSSGKTEGLYRIHSLHYMVQWPASVDTAVKLRVL